jgi:hypothetical protein
VSQQRNLIEQLQVRVEITESREIDIGIFKSRASEIRRKIFSAQQNLLARIGEIRENCLLVNQVSKNLTAREREAEVARVTFQDAVIATNNKVSAGALGIAIPEKTRGNILLKYWEHNIALGKEQAQKVTNSLEEAFNSIDDKLLGIDSRGDAEALMQMNVEQISLDMKEKDERDSTNIS